MNIAATLTRCRHSNSLVVLESSPFNGMEVRPADLRRMAQQLIAIADMADRLPLGGKHWSPTVVEIGGVVQTLNADDEGVMGVLDRMRLATGRPEDSHADALDVSPNTVKTWIHRGAVSFKFIRDFAAAQRVSIDSLIGGKHGH